MITFRYDRVRLTQPTAVFDFSLFFSSAAATTVEMDHNQPSCSTSSPNLEISVIPPSQPIQPVVPYLGNFGQYFSEQYTVRKLVLSYLNYYDLEALRGVNMSLKSASDSLLKKRIWIQSYVFEYMFTGDQLPGPRETTHWFDLKIEPKVMFTFECMPGSPYSRSKPKICKRMEDRDDEHFFPRENIVPNSVKLFIPIGAKGIIYPDKNDKNQIVIIKTLKYKNVSLLYLPNSDNYDVTTFVTPIEQTDTYPQILVHEYFTTDPRPIRGMIILRIGEPNINRLIRYIVHLVTNNQSEPFALAGGHVSSMDYDQKQKKHMTGTVKVIIFRGNGIRCISDVISGTTDNVVLEGLTETSEHVKKTLGQLQPHKSFIMMFQCLDRHVLLNEDHINIAKKFPSIPIFGMLTVGEVGFKSYKDMFHKQKRRRDDIMLQAKTTYMIITLT